MPSFILVYVLIAIALGALGLVSYANHRQKKERLVAIQVNQLKREIAALEALTFTIQPLVSHREIPALLSQQLVQKTESALNLLPSNHVLTVIHSNAVKIHEELRETKKIEIYRMQSSDTAIANALEALSRTVIILRQKQRENKITSEQLSAYLKDLSWARLMVSVASYVGHGYKALRHMDEERALAFFRKAQQIALQTNLDHNRKDGLIDELNELLEGKRTALSGTYMPEITQNPALATQKTVQTSPGNQRAS